MLGSGCSDVAGLLAICRPGWVCVEAIALAGGVSAGATRLALVGPNGAREALVARRTASAVAEQAVLRRLAAAGVVAPLAIGGDAAISLVGWVAGRALAAGDMAALAAALREVHALGLVHGDVWPGNAVVRDDGRVVLLDWEDAAEGSAGHDVGNARLELTWAFGCGAADAFLAAYGPVADLARWERTACDRLEPRLAGFGLGPEVEARMRAELAAFRARALGRD